MTLEQAWKLANRVHKEHKRFNGKPYMTHIEGVVDILKAFGITDEKMLIAAILHDTVEDGESWVTGEIFKIFGNEIGYLVKTLSIKQDQSYEEFMQHIIADKRTIIIKIADSLHNVTDNPTSGMRRKYRKGLSELIGALLKWH